MKDSTIGISMLVLSSKAQC